MTERTYVIEWAIKGTTSIEASSPDEARSKFDKMSAGSLIANGYDDIDVGEPEVEDAEEKVEA
jgi:hypothetical protein